MSKSLCGPFGACYSAIHLPDHIVYCILQKVQIILECLVVAEEGASANLYETGHVLWLKY
jgi:hypothetical protein